MNCCRREKNSASNSSMDETCVKKEVSDTPARVHGGTKGKDKKKETRRQRKARQGQTYGKGVKQTKCRKHTGHKTNNKKQQQANTTKAASQTTEHGQSDATVKSKISEMGPHGTLHEANERQVAASASQSIQNNDSHLAAVHNMETSSTITCQKDNGQTETLADISQLTQSQRDVTDALQKLEMTGHVISEQMNQRSPEVAAITGLTAREGPESVTAVQQTSTSHSGQENPSHTGHNEVTTQAVALRSTRLHNQVFTTQDGRRTIPVGQTVIIEDIDGPAITPHGERVHVKGKRIVVQQPGKCGKIGKKKYVVRKEETKMGTWLDRRLGTEHHHTSQQSYFVSDSEDEDKEYLNAAAENLDMNW